MRRARSPKFIGKTLKLQQGPTLTLADFKVNLNIFHPNRALIRIDSQVGNY